MKQSTSTRHDASKRGPAAAASGASPLTTAASPRQSAQGQQIAQLHAASPVAQLAGGKKHHDPTKKKHLAKGVGAQQKDTSAKALAIKKASPVPISNKEAKRQAKGT